MHERQPKFPGGCDEGSSYNCVIYDEIFIVVVSDKGTGLLSYQHAREVVPRIERGALSHGIEIKRTIGYETELQTGRTQGANLPPANMAFGESGKAN